MPYGVDAADDSVCAVLLEVSDSATLEELVGPAEPLVGELLGGGRTQHPRYCSMFIGNSALH